MPSRLRRASAAVASSRVESSPSAEPASSPWEQPEVEEINTKRNRRAEASLSSLREAVDAMPLRPEQSRFCSDETLLRYLRITSGNVERALSKIKGTLAWRASHVDNKPLTCRQCVADPDSHCFFALGPDRRGWELIYACPARGKNKDPDGGLNHMYMLFESVFDRNRSKGKITWMIDLHGLGLWDINPRHATTATPVAANHYPERLGQVCLLDAPAIFSLVWKSITPVLDPLTARKVRRPARP